MQKFLVKCNYLNLGSSNLCLSRLCWSLLKVPEIALKMQVGPACCSLAVSPLFWEAGLYCSSLLEVKEHFTRVSADLAACCLFKESRKELGNPLNLELLHSLWYNCPLKL